MGIGRGMDFVPSPVGLLPKIRDHPKPRGNWADEAKSNDYSAGSRLIVWAIPHLVPPMNLGEGGL